MLNQAPLNTENVRTKSPKKQVKFNDTRILQEHNGKPKEREDQKNLYDLQENIPPDLERYIRRYIGLPVMLKAGEYSPNNPLLRSERGASGATDALLGLGEYERRRNTLRKIRQAQYRQYLDQQAKKKQEAKEQAEQDRREREEKERQREERERQLLLERERFSPERRRASVCTVPVPTAAALTTKVDTGVQVDGVTAPLSVAVQTDDAELYRLSPSPSKCVTQAERELSPRTVAEPRHWGGAGAWPAGERRRSYGDFDERTSTAKKCNRAKLASDLRHTYMPSIFDADAIQLRNIQAEKEAAERRQYYQQELKSQIMEQQRIREERKSREKMLEQAEMRRLEEQLRMLRVAQEREVDKQHDITAAIKNDANDYHKKRTELQREIDLEQQKLLRSTSQQSRNLPKRSTTTSKSDTQRSKLPFFYPQSEKTFQPIENDQKYSEAKKPYSFNIPDNSIFSANYDVDSYLRKNLNFKDKIDMEIDKIGDNNKRNIEYSERGENLENGAKYIGNARNGTEYIEHLGNGNKYVENHENSTKNYDNFTNNNTKHIENNTNSAKQVVNNKDSHRNIIVEKALIHEPKERKIPKQNIDTISIPVLRHSPTNRTEINDVSNNKNPIISEAMKKVDDKWKVPAVQKNILKTLPSGDGNNISILTQLGSIRRQLQLEQLKLDKMLSKNDP